MNTQAGRIYILASLVTTELILIWVAWALITFFGILFENQLNYLVHPVNIASLYPGILAPVAIFIITSTSNLNLKWIMIFALATGSIFYFYLLGFNHYLLLMVVILTVSLAFAGEYCWRTSNIHSFTPRVRWFLTHYLELLLAIWMLLFIPFFLLGLL